MIISLKPLPNRYFPRRRKIRRSKRLQYLAKSRNPLAKRHYSMQNETVRRIAKGKWAIQDLNL